MAKKVPHKAKSGSSERSIPQNIFIILSILLAISMVASLFVGLF